MAKNAYISVCDLKQEFATDIVVRDFLQHLESLKYSPQTIQSYKNALNRFSSFLTASNINRVQDVTIHDLDKFRLFLIDEGFASKSLHTYLTNIRQFYNHLEKTLQVFANPAETLIIPKPKFKLQHVPNEDDMKKLLIQPDLTTPAGIRDRALLEVMYSTGARLEEITGINMFDVNLKQKTIKVLGKGNKERMVPLGKQAVYWLDKYLKEVRKTFIKTRLDEHALFVGAQYGRRINPQIVSTLVRGYSIKAKITSVSSHSIRRACATHLLRGGAHPDHIRKMLGHSTMKALRSYLQLTITDIKKMHKKSKMSK